MKLSARNQLKGKVSSVKEGPVSTEVIIDINGTRVASSITTTSAQNLNLQVGDEVYAIIKASSVMVAKDQPCRGNDWQLQTFNVLNMKTFDPPVLKLMTAMNGGRQGAGGNNCASRCGKKVSNQVIDDRIS